MSIRSILFYVLSIMIVFNTVYAQSVQDEANPNTPVVQDNSEYAVLWGKMVQARKSGDIELYNSLSNELNAKYPDRFRHTVNESSPFNIAVSDPSINKDWLNGDILIFGGAVAAPGTGNPNPVKRNLKLESDTLGNQFAAFINGTRDSLHIYRSTTFGYQWSKLTSIYVTGTTKFQAFDMFITDTTGKFTIGFAVSLYDNTLGQYSSTLYWMQINTDGTNFSSALIQATGGGYGYISPAIVSDGYEYSPVSSYWYIAYQRVNTSTGAGNQALLAMTTNWGTSFVIDTARNTYNDYDLDVDYSFNADSIYVLMTNNLTTANENLRLRYVALSGIGTGMTWDQYNPAGTSAPEREGTLTSNRATNALMISYTIVESGNENVNYAYSPTGSTTAFTTGPVSNNPVSIENRSSVLSQQTTGMYMFSFVSSASGYDSVIYIRSITPPVFIERTLVNQVNSSNGVAPDVDGFAAFGSVLFAGALNNGAYYDGTNIIVGIDPVNNTKPESFVLRQNYPNPFNPATKITFELPSDGLTSLSVYNNIGQLIQHLVNDELKSGTYEIIWNALSIPSGVYFYKLTSGNFSETKKMLLVK